MFNLIPNPVAWFESAINGKLERVTAIKLLGCALTGMLTFLWYLGLIPVIGKALKMSAAAMRVNLERSGIMQDLEGLQLTLPHAMYGSDLTAQFEGETLTLKKGEQ